MFKKTPYEGLVDVTITKKDFDSCHKCWKNLNVGKIALVWRKGTVYKAIYHPSCLKKIIFQRLKRAKRESKTYTEAYHRFNKIIEENKDKLFLENL